MRILNLGCGTKTSSDPKVVNIDWSIYLRIRRSWLLRPVARVLLSHERQQRLNALPDNIMIHNLARGIPFPSSSIDAVYHSHLLEHLDREVAAHFLEEVKRVLRPDGILRIVVPDMEAACRQYIAHIAVSENCPEEAAEHDAYIARIIEQSVRREGTGTSRQTPFRRFVERVVVGDARQRGETHQWMYDRINLQALLLRLNFRDPERMDYRTSRIPDWNRYQLDMDDRMGEYIRGSLYMEARK